MFEVVTHSLVAAPAAVVWTVLTDARRYPEWNPGVVHVDGELREHARLKIRLSIEGRKTPLIPVFVSTFEPRVELAWMGGRRRLLQGTHYFRMTEIHPGNTRLVHGERFVGLFSPALSPLRRKIERAYQGITDAIAREAERRARVEGAVAVA